MRVKAKKSITEKELAHLLCDLGYSVMDMARLAGVGEATAQRWADGRSRIPHSVTVLLRLIKNRPELAYVIEEHEEKKDKG